MTQRTRRSLPASLVALTLLALCVLVAVSCVQSLTGHPPWLPFDALTRLGTELTVGSPPVVIAAAVTGLLGLVLLGLAVAPGAVTVLPLDPGPSGLTSGVTRRSLVRALQVSAEGVDGVDRADVHLGTRRVRVKVTTPLHEPGALGDQVCAALLDRLADISPTRTPAIRVRIKSRDE